MKTIFTLSGIMAMSIFVSCLDAKCPTTDYQAPDCTRTDCAYKNDLAPDDARKDTITGQDISADVPKQDVAIPRKCTQPLEPQGLLPLKTNGHDFVDSHGRKVIFHGINISGMEWGKKDVFKREDLHAITKAGFNAIRFPIGWAGIEPKKGEIDQDYLDGIAEVVDWAQKEGLYVMPDMHQWFWCTVGMPRWTCLEDPKLDSEQEMQESKHFFESAALRADLAKQWGLVAGLFAGKTAILGYDLFNEPVPVTIDSMLSGAFDRDILAPFYKQIIAEIRKKDTEHVIVVEPNVGDFTTKTALPAMDDPLIAFAPHYYCPHNYVEGQGLVWLIPPSPDLLRTQYENGVKIQNKWHCPVMVGEFGVPMDKDEGPEWLDASITWQEDLNFSFFYWDYRGGWGAFDNNTKKIKKEYARHLLRPYPAAVAGHDLHWSTRAWAGWLDMDYTAGTDDLCRITEVVVPVTLFNQGPVIDVKGPANHRFDKTTHRLLIQATMPGQIVVKIR